MTADLLDVVGIGNAIVDVIAPADEALLVRHHLAKGSMTLVDAAAAERLYDAMGPAIEVSGGSAANSVVGVAGLGGHAGYIGKVRNDELGRVFAYDLRAAGVEYTTTPATTGEGTARCLINVTPDAQRTMCTFLGASAGLGPDDIDAALIRRARITYLEGYLWDPPRAKEAFRRAIAMAHEHGRLVALTLSDAFCVERYRSEFLELIAEDVDILFANEAEIKVLHHAPNFDAALQHLRGRRLTAALTRSEKGSVIVHGDALHVVDAAPVARVVDTTGAGDLFAAGFLFGCARGNTLYDAARIGSMAAAEVISHYGARPEAALRERLGELFR